MKTTWVDPVKNQPASESTMQTSGDFGKFTELMKRIVGKKLVANAPASPDRGGD